MYKNECIFNDGKTSETIFLKILLNFSVYCDNIMHPPGPSFGLYFRETVTHIKTKKC